MSEFNSRQAEKIATGKKLLPNEAYGKKRVVVITTPAIHALAQNDTIASGIALPAGTRFIADTFISHAALGAGVTVDIGIRNFKTKEVINATGIASGIAVATAGRTASNNGAYVAAGVEYVTAVPVEIYLTVGGGAPTANSQLRAEVSVVTVD